jgi:hypothetical protein
MFYIFILVLLSVVAVRVWLVGVRCFWGHSYKRIHTPFEAVHYCVCCMKTKEARCSIVTK